MTFEQHEARFTALRRARLLRQNKAALLEQIAEIDRELVTLAQPVRSAISDLRFALARASKR